MTARLVRNLTAVTVAAGLATAGLVGSADAAPAPTAISVRPAHAIYVYGQKAVVAGHVSVPNATGVTVTVAVAGQAAQVVAVTVNSAGNFAIDGTTTNNTTFTASYPGDATHAKASAATHISTRVKVISRFRGGYKTKAGYHFVHAGKHPAFGVGVAPSKTGKKVYVRLQTLRNHHWRGVQTRAYALRKGSAVAVTFHGLAGHKYRLRGEFRGDSVNASNVTGWTYVRFA